MYICTVHVHVVLNTYQYNMIYSCTSMIAGFPLLERKGEMKIDQSIPLVHIKY